MSRFRVLSLDGGGIKGTFTASILANLEKLTARRVVDHFDLITGTSTGGLIALGLGLGMPAEELLRFYVDQGPQIFPSTGPDRMIRGLRHTIWPKYSQEHLSRPLAELFGDRKLGESKCRLVVPSFDCNAGRVELFKTAHHPRFVHDYQRTAREVAMATTAAPTYFPAFSATDGQAYLDGGIWANCPIVIGLLESVFVLGRAPTSIDVLSIGTTDEPFDVAKGKRLGGILPWNRQLVDLLMQAQIDGALAQARIITNKQSLRINASTRQGRFSLDNANRIEELRGLGTHYAREFLDEILPRFLDRPVDKFEPFHQVSAEPRQPALTDAEHVARRRRRRSLGTVRTGLPRTEYRVADISVTGALLETEGEMPIGNPIELEIELENGANAHVDAVVVRNQRPEWGVTAGVGVQFTRFEGAAKAIIANYVRE